MMRADPMSTPASPAPPAQDPHLPERIGPFAIQGVLGRGGMGVVFDAIAPEGERVALKIIRPVGDPERSPTLVARFLREARILEQLDHPGVVRLVDAGDLDGVMYLAMERIEGVSLLSVRRQGPLGFDALVPLGLRLADALAHLHDGGVVHRDIKPANILIRGDGHPVITDFGISGMNEATGITRQGDLLGSPGFMAPEVVSGEPPSALSDQYALGRLLFELGARGPSRKLPKKAPIFEVLRIAQLVDWTRFPNEPPWPDLAAVVRRMLEPDPKDRYPNARAAGEALRALSSDVLGPDTLSEHVDGLGIPSSTSYEALADDLSDDLPPVGARPAEEDPTRLLIPAMPRRARPGDADTADTALPPAPGPPSRTDTETDPPLGPESRAETPALPAAPTGGDAGVPLDELLRRQDVAAAPPSPAETRIDWLERQLARTREELDRARQQAAAPAPSRLPWVLLALATGVVGAVVGTRLPAEAPEAPRITLVAPTAAVTASPPATYDRETPPSPQDLTDARGMLATAQDHLRAGRLESAFPTLEECVRIADLPDCHKLLGTILGLRQDPRARLHFVRYLQVAPAAPDADEIRRFLEP